MVQPYGPHGHGREGKSLGLSQKKKKKKSTDAFESEMEPSLLGQGLSHGLLFLERKAISCQ